MTMTTTDLQRYSAVRFAPRRLCHGNFFVTDLDRSVAFYRDVCGLNVVFEEPGISAVFFSNGNSHHDIALEQVQRAARIGRDGQVQVPEGWAATAGLNHLGWEMATEAELVAAHSRAAATGLPLHRTADHQISRSVYLWDAEHNYLEIYADAARDWRAVYAEVGDELLTGNWDPMAQPCATEARYDADPAIQRVEDALAHPLRTARATMVVGDLDLETGFYHDVVGLEILAHLPGHHTILGGGQGRVDLTLVQTDGTLPRGLHHFALELPDAVELAETRKRLEAAGIALVADIASPSKTSLIIDDPDGAHIELLVPTDRPVLQGRPQGRNVIFEF
jgi:catechol 2,3-dioxygenase